MDKINIRYTGIGARKDGNHTRKQFLSIMDKNFTPFNISNADFI